MSNPKYDSTVARIAGNIASSFKGTVDDLQDKVFVTEWAAGCVAVARAIVAEAKRTEPVEDDLSKTASSPLTVPQP